MEQEVDFSKEVEISNDDLHILNNIIDRIGVNNFFKGHELSDIINLDHNKTNQIINKALELKVFIETTFNEYGFSENTINKYNKPDLYELSKYIESNFNISNHKVVSLDQDETILKDNVLQCLLIKKRSEASESIVTHIMKNNFIYTTRDDNQSEMWMYLDGIYVPEGKTYVKEYCRKIMGTAYTNQFVNDVISKIEADTLINADDFFNQDYLDEVPVENGILNIKTKELLIFNPRKIFFNKLPICYQPDSECPLIEKHFKTILKNEEDANVLFELFGYLLLKSNRLEKTFMFVGKGRNGKSKTLELVKNFLGIKNCSALPLSSMNSESFSLSELFGKMANIAGDLSYTDLKETGVLKQLVGRDPIQTKRKFKKDLNFVNYSKLLFAANELPKVYDTTDGFWTKWVLIEFPYKFITQKEYDKLEECDRANKKIIDTDIIDKITSKEEMSGLLNMALMSLSNILKNQEFTYSRGVAEVKDMWVRQSDSFMAYCMDNLEESYDNKISKKDLRKEYYRYCKKFKVRSTSDKSIKITLENMFGCIEARAGSLDGWFWEGIKFKECNECKGVSPYIRNSNSPIGSNPVTLITLEQKTEEMLNFFKVNREKVINLDEVKKFFPDPESALYQLKTGGMIFEPKESHYQYLG